MQGLHVLHLKYAATGISESMYEETKEFAISVFCVEPGYFPCNLLCAQMKKVRGNMIKDSTPRKSGRVLS